MTVFGAFVVFAVAVLYDVLFAYYIRYSTARRALPAALASGATYLVGAIGLIAVVKFSPYYVIVESMGLALGTWLGVRRTQKQVQ